MATDSERTATLGRGIARLIQRWLGERDCRAAACRALEAIAQSADLESAQIARAALGEINAIEAQVAQGAT